MEQLHLLQKCAKINRFSAITVAFLASETYAVYCIQPAFYLHHDEDTFEETVADLSLTGSAHLSQMLAALPESRRNMCVKGTLNPWRLNNV